MPTYACSAAAGRLAPAQKLEIVQSITAIHHQETGAPRYFVQVIFYDIAPVNHYIAGQLAPAGGLDHRRAAEGDAARALERRTTAMAAVVHHSKFDNSTSAVGQKRTFSEICVMSALPPKADIRNFSDYGPNRLRSLLGWRRKRRAQTTT
jgi:phenylpyruvate tautomerase PptA (4-oxalocrotonate tautomerase family)